MRFKSLTSESPRHSFFSPPPFRSSKKTFRLSFCCPGPWKKEPFSSQNLKQGSALFRNAQVTIQVFFFFPPAKEEDKTQVFIKKTQLSSRSPAVTLSLSHPGGFPALPSFISILPPLPSRPFLHSPRKENPPSLSLSAADAALISSFQFPSRFLHFGNRSLSRDNHLLSFCFCLLSSPPKPSFPGDCGVCAPVEMLISEWGVKRRVDT